MHRLLRNLGHNICNPSKSSVDKWKQISKSSSVKELITKHQGLVDAQALELQAVKNEIITLRHTTFVNFVNLEYLVLEGVRMSSRTVELPTSLVYLRWKDGLFTSCPLNFSQLKNLTVLELVDCQSMKWLPSSVVNASKLLWLELEGCLSLTELPLGLSRVLEYLGLSRTSIKNLPSDIWNIKGLKHLHANKTPLTRVPAGLGRLELLSSLNLHGSRVTILPESVSALKGLRKLDLSDTMLTSLPESIGGLRGLQKLDLSGTYIKRLPESLGSLALLEEFQLDRSLVETLPDSFHQLHSLSFLHLGDTKITDLPDGMGELVALRKLSLTGTTLRVWPEMTSTLPHVVDLGVHLARPCENHVLSLDSRQIGDQGEENALGSREGGSQRAIQSLLSQLPLLHAVSTLCLYGKGYPQDFLQPLFVALQHMPSLSSLALLDFDLCERIPSELGLLTRIRELGLINWKRLQELPESVGELPLLRDVHLEDMPELSKLPESLRASPSLSGIYIAECKSLPGTSGSFNQASPFDSDSRPSEGRQSGPSDILRPDFPGRRQLEWVISDSLEALEFFLGCCGNYTSQNTRYAVECDFMEKVVKKAAATENGGLVMDSKVALGVISEARRPGETDQLGFPRLCSSHSSTLHRYLSLRQNFSIACQDWHECGLHSWQGVNVTDAQEEIGEFGEQDNGMNLSEEIGGDSETRKSETTVVKYHLRPLLLLGFSWFIVSRMRRG